MLRTLRIWKARDCGRSRPDYNSLSSSPATLPGRLSRAASSDTTLPGGPYRPQIVFTPPSEGRRNMPAHLPDANEIAEVG